MNDIEVNKDGIKISYVKFIGDSSIGFLLIIFCILCIYAPKIFMPCLDGYQLVDMPKEVGIFVSILLFFLSTAIGGAINALSWFLLVGKLEVWLNQRKIEKRIIEGKKDFLFRFFYGASYNSVPIERAVDFFDLKPGNGNENNFLTFFRLLKRKYFEDTDSHNFFPVIGQRIFFRNLTMIFLLASVACIVPWGGHFHFYCCNFFTYLFLSFFSFLLTLSEDFYLTCKGLTNAYLFCLQHEELSNQFRNKKEEEKIVEFEKIIEKERIKTAKPVTTNQQ